MKRIYDHRPLSERSKDPFTSLVLRHSLISNVQSHMRMAYSEACIA